MAAETQSSSDILPVSYHGPQLYHSAQLLTSNFDLLSVKKYIPVFFPGDFPR
jgi:hypothetical protein